MSRKIHKKDLVKNNYTVSEVANFMNMSASTIRNWDKKNIVQFERTPTNIRTLPKKRLVKLLKEYCLYEEGLDNNVVIRLQKKSENTTITENDKELTLLIEKHLDSSNPQDRLALDALFSKLLAKEVLYVVTPDYSLLGPRGSVYLPKILDILGIELRIEENS